MDFKNAIEKVAGYVRGKYGAYLGDEHWFRPIGAMALYIAYEIRGEREDFAQAVRMAVIDLISEIDLQKVKGRNITVALHKGAEWQFPCLVAMDGDVCHDIISEFKGV